MKLAIFGHSYVNHLATLGINNFKYSTNIIFQIKYFGYSGATYSDFLKEPFLLYAVSSYEPDFVVVIMGGNDINIKMNMLETKRQCKDFFELLRVQLPKTIIIASQIELRWYPPTNKRNCPAIDRYKKIRNELNKFINQLSTKDSLLLLGGRNNLDNCHYYNADRVHLNVEGNKLLLEIIRNCIKHNMTKFFPTANKLVPDTSASREYENLIVHVQYEENTEEIVKVIEENEEELMLPNFTSKNIATSSHVTSKVSLPAKKVERTSNRLMPYKLKTPHKIIHFTRADSKTTAFE